MVLLSCSGAGGGIYAKLASGVDRHNCSGFPPHNSVAATALIEGDAVSALSTANAPQLGLMFKAGFIVIGSLSTDSFAIRSGYVPAPRAKAAM